MSAIGLFNTKPPPTVLVFGRRTLSTAPFAASSVHIVMWHLLLVAAGFGTAAAQAVQPCDVRDYSFAYCLPTNDGLGPGNFGTFPPNGNTLDACAEYCKVDRYPYFLYGSIDQGVPYCYCSPSILSVDPVDPARCNQPCPGNPTEICRGEGVGSLYVNNCFEPNPNTAVVGPFGYIGCFDGVVEDTLLDLLGPIVNAGESASLEQCRSKCSGELFVNVGYFAIQRSDSSGSPGARCACGEELNPERYEAADSRCTAPCPSGGGFCGNPTNGVNVYSQSAAPFVAASRSCTSLVTTSTTTPAELIGTETATSTTTTTVDQPAVTSTCATSTATATQASTVTASTTVTVAKPKTSTCYRTVTRTITSTCRPPKTRYARDSDHVSIFARQNADVGTCTVSNGEVTTSTISFFVTTSTTTATITATRPADVICNTATSTITVTNPTTTTTTATVTKKGKTITTTKKKTVTATKYPRHAPTCKKKKSAGYY
ncbi:hypothetical protein CB0940_06713 [Cercospora beticola]|uniref:WSC domain-containing protein n=1 Tax=Cercospora beticola TaxID=122368 RepID=A0A2G5H999_CERBT|nr:hypothetical protein CB0940_06713 [Cercospora beticola]PIA89107.1 hypothetical protein CB0940_06713 [Cercospora beticola]WPB02612.1 hypothetical protein RHO25_007248 [Cercospora beticola]